MAGYERTTATGGRDKLTSADTLPEARRKGADEGHAAKQIAVDTAPSASWRLVDAI